MSFSQPPKSHEEKRGCFLDALADGNKAKRTQFNTVLVYRQTNQPKDTQEFDRCS